jgi:hypothetical protein
MALKSFLERVGIYGKKKGACRVNAAIFVKFTANISYPCQDFFTLCLPEAFTTCKKKYTASS